MSSSESDAESQSSATLPKPKALEDGLRNTVRRIFKSGDLDGLTVKRVRLATEKDLGLQEGFFKADELWKQQSAEIIKDEVEIQEDPSNAKPTKAPPKKKPVKRTSKSEALPANKRRKKNVVSESEEEDEEEEEKEQPASPPSEESEPESRDEREEDGRTKSDDKEVADGSESEMSVLIDEEPKPKSKSKKKSPPQKAQEKTKKKATGKAKETPDTDPDQAEIKRLQGWLVKCGIRKMWFRELAPYDTPTAKIRHLKSMLKDAGMEGRYSQEKANRIREERELKADLEMVQEGAKRWGKGEESDGEAQADVRPRRRIARGFQKLDFLDQEDEESD